MIDYLIEYSSYNLFREGACCSSFMYDIMQTASIHVLQYNMHLIIDQAHTYAQLQYLFL